MYKASARLVGGMVVLARGKLASRFIVPSIRARRILSGSPITGAKGVAIPNRPEVKARNITSGTSGRMSRFASGAMIETLPNSPIISGNVMMYADIDSMISLGIIFSARNCFSSSGPIMRIP